MSYSSVGFLEDCGWMDEPAGQVEENHTASPGKQLETNYVSYGN